MGGRPETTHRVFPGTLNVYCEPLCVSTVQTQQFCPFLSIKYTMKGTSVLNKHLAVLEK